MRKNSIKVAKVVIGFILSFSVGCTWGTGKQTRQERPYYQQTPTIGKTITLLQKISVRFPASNTSSDIQLYSLNKRCAVTRSEINYSYDARMPGKIVLEAYIPRGTNTFRVLSGGKDFCNQLDFAIGNKPVRSRIIRTGETCVHLLPGYSSRKGTYCAIR